VNRARRRFGQHFLEPAWVDKVVAAIDPKGNQPFLEIGPGRGALTVPLAARSARVVAVEIDRDLARALREKAIDNLTLIEGDVLEARVQDDVRSLVAGDGRPFRVAGNLPYNVASPILLALIDLFNSGTPFEDATLMLQREVADRLLASAGTKTYGTLTILVGQSARIERVLNLPAGAFRPAPKVLSSLVRLRFHRRTPDVRDPTLFRALVQAVFSRRRKTMANAVQALSRARRLPAWLDGRRRPETLTIAEFARLSDDFSR
jgi:16S rRNA (adenine1518-N6/adenine1519-N6)-dimethyltransferase